MGKLYETFSQIDSGRRKCIDSLKARNVLIDEDANFDAIAEGIRYSTDELNIVHDQHLWERPEEWINTEELLLNAPELDGYSPFAIYLLYDNFNTITLTLSTSSYNGYDAYYLSDGTFITVTNEEHTWDKTKDIKTTLGYNLRYVIEYVKNTKLTTIDGYYGSGSLGSSGQKTLGDSLLEVTAKNISTNASVTLALPKCSAGSYCNVLRVHVLDTLVQFRYIGEQNTNYGVQEIKIDQVGSFTMNFYNIIKPYTTNITNRATILLPNVTELVLGSGTSSQIFGTPYLYAPKLETITQNGTSSYGTGFIIYPYAPKLVSVNMETKVSILGLKYLLSLTSSGKLSQVTDYYQHELFSRRNDLISSIPSGNLDAIYNATIEELTNTSGLSNNYIGSIDLPRLVKIAYSDMFIGTNIAATTHFVVGDGFKSNLNISKMVNLPSIYIHHLLNKLANVTGEGETYTLTLGTTLLAKLSDEEKAIATNKGWVLK